MTWPVLLWWFLLLVAGISRGPLVLYLFFAAAAFDGLSLLPPSILGNVPVTTICAAVFIGKTFIGKGRFNALLGLALDGRKFGVLTLFCLYVIITAFIYPRLLAGQVQLFALNHASSLSFLRPTSSNITQPIYMVISVLMAFVFAHRGRDLAFRKQFLYASLVGAGVLLATGVIDAVVGGLGREDLLLPFHTATYHLLDSVSIAGQKRVVGFEPEASIFGSICCSQLGFLIFARPFYGRVARTWIVPAVILGLIYMVYASTSSAGYVGLMFIFSVVGVRFVARLVLASDMTPALLRQVFWLAILIAVAGVGSLFLPHSFYARVQLLLDSVLFQKTTSSSYIERSAWTHAGVMAFYATHGIGVGVGSIRTSNWYVNFAASTGIVGIILFGGFVLWMVLPSRNFPDAQSRQFATALKLYLIPFAIGRALGGTTPDPGAALMLALGLIYALKNKPRLEPARNPAIDRTAPLAVPGE